MKNKVFAMFDYLLILVVLTLVALGVMFIYSSSINSEGVRVTNEYIKQIIWASIGFVIMIGITIYDYRRTESLSIYGFIGLLLLLIYTRIFGRYVNGAKSWIGIGEFGIQPSELGKVFYILYLARILDDTANGDQLKRFFLATGVLLLPMGLILLQLFIFQFILSCVSLQVFHLDIWDMYFCLVCLQYSLQFFLSGMLKLQQLRLLLFRFLQICALECF